jgi:hypothetical protein
MVCLVAGRNSAHGLRTADCSVSEVAFLYELLIITGYRPRIPQQ